MVSLPWGAAAQPGTSGDTAVPATGCFSSGGSARDLRGHNCPLHGLVQLSKGPEGTQLPPLAQGLSSMRGHTQQKSPHPTNRRSTKAQGGRGAADSNVSLMQWL